MFPVNSFDMAETKIADRVKAVDWRGAAKAIAAEGYARTGPLLSGSECAALAVLYADDEIFRSRIDMARYRFGEGEYKYFANPLPGIVGQLRTHLYRKLAPVANRMMADLGRKERYPASLSAYLKICHKKKQTRPTPLMLRYQTGGYNCLHQDLYGDLRFPLQVTIGLSRPGTDYTGGEFLLVEQRPRAQSRGEAIQLEQGEAIIFPVAERPVEGRRGMHACTMRHGVSRVRGGVRYALGIIFHDAA